MGGCTMDDAPAGRHEVAPTPAELRPIDDRPVHTADLPDTPTRDRSIPATAWLEAPAELLALAQDLPAPTTDATARYLRRIGPWLLWRAGPAKGAAARYWVCLSRRPDRAVHLRPVPRRHRVGPRSDRGPPPLPHVEGGPARPRVMRRDPTHRPDPPTRPAGPTEIRDRQGRARARCCSCSSGGRHGPEDRRGTRGPGGIGSERSEPRCAPCRRTNRRRAPPPPARRPR